MHLRTPTSLTIVLLATAGFASPPQQVPSAYSLTVSEPRPLAAVIRELERRHGWAITYEDPPYEFAGDIQDVTASVARTATLDRKVLVPLEHMFQFGYTAADITHPKDLLASMLSRYQDLDHGSFRLLEQGGVFHVIPLRSRNAKGQAVARTSLLDVRVSIAPSDQTAMDTIRLALLQVQAQTGVTLGVGMAPGNLFQRTRMPRRNESDESAREAIGRAMAATNQPVSWQLLCSPAPRHDCGFSLHLVTTQD